MAYIKKSYNRDGSLRRYGRHLPRGISGLGDDACTPYGATMNADGTCHFVASGSGSNMPIETTMTGGGAVPGSQQASGSSWFDSLMKGFANVTSPAQQPMPVVQQSGISTTTLVIGGVALVGLALLLKSRS